MKRFLKPKIHVINCEDDKYEEAAPVGEEMDALPLHVQTLLDGLGIQHGQQLVHSPRGSGSGSSGSGAETVDIDPTQGLLNHIIDSVAALRDTVRVFRKKNSPFANTVGEKIATSLIGELGKVLIYSLTNDWQGHEEVERCYFPISRKIVSTFPEMASRKHKSSGKMLLHHATLKSNSDHSAEYVKALVEVCPSSAASADAHGALPLHWAMRNKATTVDIVRCLLSVYAQGARCKDINGFLPLHWAVHQETPKLDIIAELLRAFPEGTREVCGTGGLPLHWAVNLDNVSIPVVKVLYKLYPAALSTPCKEGWLPLHRLVDRSRPNIEALQYIVSKYPASLRAATVDGHLPLHKAVDHHPLSLDVVNYLVDAFPNAARVADADGYLPIHIALDCSQPDMSAVYKLLQAFPNAASRQTLDGYLPLHMVVSTNSAPSIELVQALVSLYPTAAQHMAVDLLPADPKANPETWHGEWVENKWTPLSRAVERKLKDVVSVLKDAIRSIASQRQHEPTGKAHSGSSHPSVDNHLRSVSDCDEGDVRDLLAPLRVKCDTAATDGDFEMSSDSELDASRDSSSGRASSGRRRSIKSRTEGGRRGPSASPNSRLHGSSGFGASEDSSGRVASRGSGGGGVGGGPLMLNQSPLRARSSQRPDRDNIVRTSPLFGTRAGGGGGGSGVSKAIKVVEALSDDVDVDGDVGGVDVDDNASVATEACLIAPKSAMHSRFQGPSIIVTAPDSHPSTPSASPAQSPALSPTSAASTTTTATTNSKTLKWPGPFPNARPVSKGIQAIPLALSAPRGSIGTNTSSSHPYPAHSPDKQSRSVLGAQEDDLHRRSTDSFEKPVDDVETNTSSIRAPRESVAVKKSFFFQSHPTTTSFFGGSGGSKGEKSRSAVPQRQVFVAEDIV